MMHCHPFYSVNLLFRSDQHIWKLVELICWQHFIFSNELCAKSESRCEEGKSASSTEVGRS